MYPLSEISPIGKIFTDASLYEKINVTTNDEKALKDLYTFEGKIELFCTECGKERVFVSYFDEDNNLKRVKNLFEFFGPPPSGSHIITIGSLQKQESIVDKKNVFSNDFTCSFNKNHTVHFLFFLENNYLQLIGQYPSKADMAISSNKKYKKVLEEDLFYQLNRADGLFSHGIGIGSYVYLRRIIEVLIEKYHLIALKEQTGWNEDDYLKFKFKEKIKTLHAYLPQFLYDNINIYSILSKGIHELTEQDCLQYYKSIKIAIELILDQELANIEADKKKESATKEIQRISTVVSKT